MASNLESSTPSPGTPQAATSAYAWLGAVVLGVFTGTQFLLISGSRKSLITGGLLAGGAWLLAAGFFFRRLKPGSGTMPWLWYGGILLCAANALIIFLQQARVEGTMVAGVVAICGLFLLVPTALAANLQRADLQRMILMSLAVAFSWIALVNVAADQLHLGGAGLQEREQMFTARLGEGGFRWQTPLTSSWQVSGMLRWAVPVCLWFAWSARRDAIQALVWLACAVVGVYVLIRVEYRAAAMPLIFAFGWMLLPGLRLRVIAALSAMLYLFVAPFLLTSGSMQGFLIQHLPDQIPALLGQDVTQLVTLSDRSEIWEQGLELLRGGQYFWAGQGHYALDAMRDGYSPPNWDVATTQLFRRLSYHQGFLDFLLIYGIVAAAVILLVGFVVVARGTLALLSRGKATDVDGRGALAVFSLGIVAMTNAHDGFLVEHPFYYLIVAASLEALRQTSRDARKSTNPHALR